MTKDELKTKMQSLLEDYAKTHKGFFYAEISIECGVVKGGSVYVVETK